MFFLRTLRSDIKQYGKENIVYFDESGFEENINRTHAWAKKEREFAEMFLASVPKEQT